MFLLKSPQAAAAQLQALPSPMVPLALTASITTALSSPFSPQSTEQVAAFCRSLHEMNPCECSAPPQDCAGPQLSTMRQLTDADKLRKVICELLETERTYVKVRASAFLQPLLAPSLLLLPAFHVSSSCIQFCNLCLKCDLPTERRHFQRLGCFRFEMPWLVRSYCSLRTGIDSVTRNV